MPGRSESGLLLLWLLLLPLLQLTWATLKVVTTSSPIRARPGSAVQLPCYFSDSSGPLSLSKLAVVWKVGNKVIAQYEDNFKPMRPGAVMSVEKLQEGDATLLLQGIQDSDASVYTCFVIHMPNSREGRVELKVEAPPRLALSSTKVQLAKLSAVTCTMSEFYPGPISVEWLRNDKVIKGPESPLLQDRADGLFSAESVLWLTPQIADVDANFSCRARHKAMDGDGLLRHDFQLQVQARPIIQDLIVVEGKNLNGAKCLVGGFYPKEVKVQLLRDGVPQVTMQSVPQQMPNGTFTIHSAILQEESDPRANYVCQVLHETLKVPLRLTAHWQPEDESEEIICPTSPTSQSTGKKLSCQPSQPALTPASPTGSSGCSELCVPSYVVIGLIVFASAMVLGAGVLYYKTRGKHKSASGTQRETRNLQDVKESSGSCKAEKEDSDETELMEKL